MTSMEELLERVKDLESKVAILTKQVAEHAAAVERLTSKKKKRPDTQQPALIPGGITEGNGTGKVPTTEQSKRVATIFRRRHTTPWSDKEIAAYKRLGTIPEADLAVVEEYYASDAQFLRRDLMTFLNNFHGELDRARAWKREHETTKRRTVFTA